MRITAIVAVIVASIVLIGCETHSLSVSDALAMPGRATVLEAQVVCGNDRDTRCAKGVPVTFKYHDRVLGETTTDESGVARVACDLAPEVNHYRVEARVEGHPLSMEGLVHSWPTSKTVIVCDIDETVSLTHYHELVNESGEDFASKPLEGAAEVLTELSKDYGLVFLTARPGYLLEKTKRWLARNGFPTAAVITTPSLLESLKVKKYKAAKIRHLRTLSEEVAIGIGNATTDSEAYASQGLLPLIIHDRDDHRFRAHAIILKDWKAVRRFFEANRSILMNAARLREAIANEEMIARPIVRYGGRD